MESLLRNQHTVPAHLHIKPDHSAGVPMLFGWVGVVAYVVAFAGIHTNLNDSSQKSVQPLLQIRNLQMDLYLNKSADICTDPYNYACGNYATIEGTSPFRAASFIMKQKLIDTEVYKTCVFHTIFDTCSADADNDLATNLMNGRAVAGWVARVGLHKGKAVLHVWNNDVTDQELPIENPWCKFIFGNEIASENVVLYDSHYNESTYYESENNYSNMSFCSFATNVWELAENKSDIVEAAPDCPCNCAEAVQRLTPGALAGELQPDESTRVRIETLAERLRTEAGVNTTVHIGGGSALVPDESLMGKVSVIWDRHLRTEAMTIGLRNFDTPIWSSAADEVNAFYDPCQNAVFVPAGMLSRPFYDSTYDDELVLGGIGFIIAHELGHAMDHLLNESETRSAVLDHMTSVTNIPRQVVNHTLSEDIADELGGRLLTKLQPISRRTGLQLAQGWCLGGDNFTADVHAPGSARVNTLMTEGGALGGTFCTS